MRNKALSSAWLLLAAAVVGNACGSLNDGAIEITDGQGGSESSGGGTATGGSGGTSSGGSGGSAGMSANGGASEGGAGGAEGGEAGTPGTGGAGGASGGGPTATGGVDAGGAGGSGGGVPGCMTSAECTVAAPICKDGTCEKCSLDDECKAISTALPYCAIMDGRCVGCLEDANCPAATPICGTDSICRKCSEGSECPSLACNGKGACATETQAVYALAETGSSAATCGTRDTPCSSLATAATKLTAARPNLVLLPTKATFIDGATLPSALNLFVFGNKVKVAPYSGGSAFVVSGGTVSFEDVVVQGIGAGSTSSMPNPGIVCTGATIKFHRGTISNFGDLTRQNGTPGLSMTGCNAEVTESTFLSNGEGIHSVCATMTGGACASGQSLSVERSYFEANVTTIYFDGATALIRNNLFIKNGFVDYCRVIQLSQSATTGLFAYNTMYGNENGCIYTGLLACGGMGSCGQLSSNLSWNDLQKPMPCPTQVYYPTGLTMTNSLAEATWAGTGNISGQDPLFTDAAKGDFSLRTGSPALNKGNRTAAIRPTVDYYGNPRPATAPDIGAIETQ